MRMLWGDTETFSTVPIDHGVYNYAPHAELLLFTYAVDDGPVKIWDVPRGEPMPGDLRDALEAHERYLRTFHNAAFDRLIVKHALGIDMPLETLSCSMVQAYSHGFPGSLDGVGAALGLPKDKAKISSGKKLIHRFCKPAPANHKADRYTEATHPEEWEQFRAYAIQDVEAMREVVARLPTWNWKPSDIRDWHLDQRINDRGMQIDVELCRAGAKASADERKRLDAEFQDLVCGIVSSPAQRAAFASYLNQTFGTTFYNTRGETFDAYMRENPDCHPDLRRLMELSISANKTSTAKYKALLPMVSPDGRYRGGLQFRGAARTRRYAGRGFQGQNLPSRGLPAQEEIDQFTDALKADCHDILFDNLNQFGAASLRSLIVAGEGRRLGVADLSNIEGRLVAYLADEQWKVEAFAAYDRGEGPDLYNVTAVNSVGGDPYDLAKAIRNSMGKVPELACGFMGGFGALMQFAKSYRVDWFEHADVIRANMPDEFAKAGQHWDWWGKERNPDVDPALFQLVEAVKISWRSRHPATVALWDALKQSITNAILAPGTVHRAGKHLSISVREHAGLPYLLIKLPSGNFLTYLQPRVHDDGAITFMGQDSTESGGAYGQWKRKHAHAGHFLENAAQTIALDILMGSAPRIEADDMQIVLSVHDEWVVEFDEDRDVSELVAHMSRVPDWLPGFPLAADGFTDVRYRKG